MGKKLRNRELSTETDIENDEDSIMPLEYGTISVQ